MPLILYPFGGAATHDKPVSYPNQPRKQRRRLQKPPKVLAVHSCKEAFDVFQAKLVPNLIPAYDDGSSTRVNSSYSKSRVGQPHIGTLLLQESQPLSDTIYSLDNNSYDNSTDTSIYSRDNMDIEILKRTRAKTPCFWVGALDEKPEQVDEVVEDPANIFANNYQAELPLRTFTPNHESLPTPLRKTVRKIKGQLSLRDLVTCDRPYSSSDSISSTLVGSDTPKSQASPASGYFPSKLSRDFPSEDASQPQDNHKDIRMQICVDLLTNALATEMFKQHPGEDLDRASGLQIMLMIEAYENVQQHIRQEIHELHVTGKNPDHVEAVDNMLGNWLEALYALYDQSEARKTRKNCGPISISYEKLPLKSEHRPRLPETPDEFFDCAEYRLATPFRTSTPYKMART